MRKSFEKFLARQEALARQYGEAYEEKQHNRGKLTARERIEFLFDEIENFLLENCINGDLLITMGAGDVVKIGENLLGK